MFGVGFAVFAVFFDNDFLSHIDFIFACYIVLIFTFRTDKMQ